MISSLQSLYASYVNYWPSPELIAARLGTTPLMLYVIFFALIVWSLFWKGIALWCSARNSQKRWFIAFLIINTVGVVEIIYLLFFQPKISRPSSTPSPSTSSETPIRMV